MMTRYDDVVKHTEAGTKELNVEVDKENERKQQELDRISLENMLKQQNAMNMQLSQLMQKEAREKRKKLLKGFGEDLQDMESTTEPFQYDYVGQE